MSKISVRKYEAMNRAMFKDERVRGLLQFYGTAIGGWAVRLVQVQNLPHNDVAHLDFACNFLLEGNSKP